MNSKSRIRQVILVNWKGMFFQPFTMDDGMTILEGANGTGKTTIMIAAYTCLMPDLNFLNFQNVSAMNVRKNEDKGLYGRLGQGDPVFSMLDIVTADGERHLAGVQLIKKTYPQVQLKHFAVRHIDPDADLEQILLVQDADSNRQEIPSLSEIGETAPRVGGELIHFRHAREYFRFLFEAGITPVRLAENEERKQYNQLLHTSLYGGLSRSLQSSLRDYLLPQDNTLLSSIQDMEQNLLTCRRTRATIQRYQSVRSVIEGVYQNGLDMFSAGFCASRLAAEQSLQKALEIRGERRSSRARWEVLSEKIIETRTQMYEQEERFRGAVRTLETARKQLETARSAREIGSEIERRSAQRDKQRQAAEEARSTYKRLKETEKVNRARNQELTGQQLELARKLSNAGEAWENLSRQVGLYQQAAKLLAETRKLLSRPELEPDDIEDTLTETRHAFTEAEAAHQEAYDRWQEANLRQKHRERYRQLLHQLTDEPPSDTAARRVCDEFRELENRFAQRKTLPEKLANIEDRIARREGLLEHLKTAEFEGVTSAADLEAAWQALNTEITQREAQLSDLRHSLREKSDALQSAERQLPELKRRQSLWEGFQEDRRLLENRTARSIGSRKELSYMRKSLDDTLLKRNLERYRIEADLKSKQLLFNTLLNAGTADERLKALADEGHGDLLANRYEDIPAEWSANLESRLGPLAGALVVKDVQTAAEEIAKSYNRPEEVWLVEKDQQEKLPESRELLDSILVKHGDAWRLSRLPEHPALGKRARTEKVESLRKEIGTLTDELEKIQQRIKGAEENQALLARLIPHETFLEASPPLETLEAVEQSIPGLQEALSQLNARETRLLQTLEKLNTRRKAAEQTFRDKDLLAATDLESEYERLQSEQAMAGELEAEINRKRDLVRELQQGLETLSSEPVDTAQLEARLQQAREAEERTRAAVEALQRLSETREHFAYADQVPLLEEKKGFNQHLNDQLAEIDRQQQDIEAEYAAISEELAAAEESLRTEDKALITLEGQLAQLQENLERLETPGSDEAVQSAEKAAKAAEAAAEAEEKRLNELKTAGFQMEAEIKQVQETKLKAETAWKRSYVQTSPVLQGWRLFRNQARNENKLERLLAEFHAELQSGVKRPDRFWRRESASRATLLKTLEGMTNTGVLLDTIRANRSEDESDEISQGRECLFIWQQIRGFLNQIIPVDLQTSDPETAQATIAEKLDTLEANLEQQERSLRQHVQNIPSHINARIRKEKSRIRQLNEKLSAVRFGFLQTIRINIETQPRLKAFLDMLPQQLDFFTDVESENVPVETLMANLYEEMGAGKVKGDLLLDYRHYVRLNIEVRREGTEDFETVTSTNLSTGESIGVGISVLIMVLMSWEEQAALLRGAEQSTSLRFLLLDESSRLDQKALATLNEFCASMELQLMIAAPSVEKTLRGTTHHLTRGYYDGREEVIVRGRRLK